MTVYGHKSWEIAAYIYRADIWHGECLPMCRNTGDHPEAVLDDLARKLKINRLNEREFDSEEFPKPVFADEADGQVCGHCLTRI